jgi:hypothetical protein
LEHAEVFSAFGFAARFRKISKKNVAAVGDTTEAYFGWVRPRGGRPFYN